MSDEEKINKLKVEIFDIQRQQGQHQLEINKLQEERIKKLRELEELEK